MPSVPAPVFSGKPLGSGGARVRVFCENGEAAEEFSGTGFHWESTC